MGKKSNGFLDTEAMKLGYIRMLMDVKTQLEKGQHQESIKAVLTDRLTHIEQRLEALK
ncbi:hypothetical protein [Cohnella kolymensis]|uniref:hypothetical protein n=1 Tax=Cohnella kolymensis TaxID=1590652 RepID=UPI000A706D2F|nr:hypothetical protein [Cohnella kolymensis]